MDGRKVGFKFGLESKTTVFVKNTSRDRKPGELLE